MRARTARAARPTAASTIAAVEGRPEPFPRRASAPAVVVAADGVIVAGCRRRWPPVSWLPVVVAAGVVAVGVVAVGVVVVGVVAAGTPGAVVPPARAVPRRHRVWRRRCSLPARRRAGRAGRRAHRAEHGGEARDRWQRAVAGDAGHARRASARGAVEQVCDRGERVAEHLLGAAGRRRARGCAPARRGELVVGGGDRREEVLALALEAVGRLGALALAQPPVAGGDAQQQRAVGDDRPGGEAVDGAHLGDAEARVRRPGRRARSRRSGRAARWCRRRAAAAGARRRAARGRPRRAAPRRAGRRRAPGP